MGLFAPRRRILGILVALLLVVAACGEGGGEEAPEATTPPPESSTPPESSAPAPTVTVASDPDEAGTDDTEYPLLSELPPIGDPDPLDIDFTPDADHSGTSLLGPDGGSVTATASDGATYTLTVPPGALISPVDITLTPLASVETEGLGELEGVLMEPEGLIFLQSAELRIETGAGAEDLFTAGAFAGGEDFHLTSSDATGTVLTTTLNHFSLQFRGHTDLKREIEGSYQPSRGQAVYEQRKALLETANGPRSAQNADVYDASMVQLFHQWRNNSVLPELELSKVAPAILDQAIGNALRWKDEAEAWPWDGKEADIAAVDQALGDALATAINRSAAECRTKPESAADLLRYVFLSAEIGTPVITVDALEPVLRSCLSFTFEMESKFLTEMQEVVDGDVHTFEMITTARVKIPVALEYTSDPTASSLGFGFELKSTGAVTLSGEATAEDLTCTVSGTGSLTVNLDVTLNLSYTNRGFDTITAELEIPRSSAPQETFTCHGNDATPGAPIWYFLFLQARDVQGQRPVAIIPLDLVSEGSTIAKETLVVFIETPPASESTDLKVVHTPG